MSHPAQRDFIQIIAKHLPEFFIACNALEVGSLNINGSVRDFFRSCDYVGIDVAPGRDVDLVCEGQNFGGPDNHFKHVLSCEAMEHNPHWRETFLNMIRVCAPGGLVTMTCATTGRLEHGTTRTTPRDSPLTLSLGWDYYANRTKNDFLELPRFRSKFSAYKFWINWRSFDLYFCGLKTSEIPNKESEIRWYEMVVAVDQYTRQANALKICRYRAFSAKIGGDPWFSAMRKLAKLLDYVHSSN
ncbi:MAG: hypothetical protein ACKVQA_16090 [Burkholderiales bacterium]